MSVEDGVSTAEYLLCARHLLPHSVLTNSSVGGRMVNPIDSWEC